MTEPFVGEIRMFAGNFAPRGWALCDGQLLAISSNDALFSLLGTIYGGDGRTTFSLPDLRGRLPIHRGSGPGLSERRLGSKGGSESETLTVNQMPHHNHDFMATHDTAIGAAPSSTQTLAKADGVSPYASPESLNQMHGANIAAAGGSQSHTNMMPSLCLNFIIALFGIYPSRS